MTFDPVESSRQLSEPISLYFFRYGDTPDSYFAYTDAEQPVTMDFSAYDTDLGLVEFTPRPVNRTAYTTSGSLDKSELNVRTPEDDPLVSLFKLHPPSQVIQLTIFQGHADDTDFKVAWSGRVLGWQLVGNEVEYTCEPVSTMMRRAGLRRNYQYGCPHPLYSQGDGLCNADEAAATFIFPVTLVQGAVVSVSFVDPDQRDKFLGGIVTWTTSEGRTEKRTLIRWADSDTMILSGYATGMQAGSSASVSYGCSHQLEYQNGQPVGDCFALHNNVQNYGGQLWIPTENPIGIVNNFY